MFSPIGRGTLFLIAVCLAAFGVTKLAFGNEALTRTHACAERQVAITLAEVLTREGFDSYRNYIEPLLDNGTCVRIIVPAHPPPFPPVHATNGDGFSIHVRLVTGERGLPLYAILIHGDARKIARSLAT